MTSLDVARHFAGRPADQPPEWVAGPTAPLLDGAATTISCRPWRTYDGGDHLIIIGEVEAVDLTDRAPLLFHGGQFRYLSPRHDSGARPPLGRVARLPYQWLVRRRELPPASRGRPPLSGPPTDPFPTQPGERTT
ncbi:flavin reductase family protein [Nocardioides sp. B-3]|uniref:flavin reductase family protein n=1 Tax=Nocardioides sp. B-3 TaxID=2895565 RepID=UPI0021537DFC|nr:flavin reductase family protein [Nocardioides sp. B-3]